MRSFVILCFLLATVASGFFVPPPTRESRLVLHGIVESVSESMKEAMKSKDKERLAALRNLRAAFLTAMKEDGAETLPDDKAMALLRKLQKMRKESIEMYQAANRLDMIGPEQVELDIIEGYLPKLADEATTRKWVQEAIEATKAGGPKDMGKVMGAIMKNHKDDIDGNLVRTIVTEMLGALGK